MINRIEAHLKEVESFETNDIQQLERFRIRFLGRKGILNELFAEFRNLPPEQKREIGKPLNLLKKKAEEKVNLLKEQIESQSQYSQTNLDLTLEPGGIEPGALHPVGIVKTQIIDIFSRVGFSVSEGPEIVDDWHNFTALNFPPDHPAKDMQDTFFIQQNPDILLRTHTSSVQVQEMQSRKLPIRIIAIGRVYRNETITYKSHVQFHQVEGLYVDKNVSFTDLKQILYYFVQQFFGDAYEARFRPSYFPFTEPSAEMDVRPKGSQRWMEILGCGMVDPNVLQNCGINPEIYTGYAFGMGIERMAMLKYNISDIRILYENDVRFLKNFIAE